MFGRIRELRFTSDNLLLIGLGILMFLILFSRNYIPSEYQGVFGWIGIIGYFSVIVAWHFYAQLTVVKKRVIKGIIEDIEDTCEVQWFFDGFTVYSASELKNSELKELFDPASKGFLTEIHLSSAEKYKDKEFDRVLLVSKRPLEEVHPPNRGTVIYSGWEVDHPYVCYIPMRFIGFYNESGEWIPIFVTLAENWSDINVESLMKQLINVKLLNDKMRLELYTKQLEGYIPLFSKEPDTAEEKLARLMHRISRDVGDIYTASLEFRGQPLYKSFDFWFFIGIGIIILFMILHKLGVVVI